MSQGNMMQQRLTDASQALAREQERANSIQFPTPPNYKQDFEPHGWRKAVGIGLKMIPLLPAQLGSQELLRLPQYERAVGDYERNRTSAMDQLAAEREVGVPIANDRARVAQEGFTNWLNLQKEGREQKAFENEPTGRMPYQETGPDGKVHWYQDTKGGRRNEVSEPREVEEDRRKREEDANTPAPGARPEPDPAAKGKWRVKTKSGDYMPYMPKSVDEGAMLGDPNATKLFNQEHYHEGAQGGGSGMTAAQSREFTTRSRPIQRQMDALDRERSEYTKMQAQAMMTGVQLPGMANVQTHLQGLDQKREALQKQMDDIETEIMSRGAKGGAAAGKTEKSGGAFTVPKGAPSPSKPNDYLKADGKAIAYSKDGKTWGPLPATNKSE